MLDKAAAFVAALTADEATDIVIVCEFVEPSRLSEDRLTFVPERVVLRRALWSHDVLYDADGSGTPQRFYSDSFALTNVDVSMEGESPRFAITFQNIVDPEDAGETIDAPWARLVKTQALVGLEFRFYIVSLGLKDEADTEGHRLEFSSWYVGTYQFVGNDIKFVIGGPFDMLALEVLSPTVGSALCWYEYKGDECQSRSGLPTCPHDVPGCIARFPNGQPIRFSSWPWVDFLARRA